MKLDGSEFALQSAQMAFEQEQFERAQNVCSELLGLLEQNHVCKTFSECIVLAAKLSPKLSDDEQLRSGLASFESGLCNDERPCVLSHVFSAQTDTFCGTMDSFESIRIPMTNKGTGRCDFTSSVNEPRVLELLCEICLDNGLYSCALNLALQLHLIATPTKQSSANGSSDWIKSCELVLDEDYISFTRSHPAGLSESLWLRLTRLCRSFSPAVPPYIKPHITPTELSRQTNVELVDNEDTLQSELDESIPNGTTSSVLLESAHFGKVNEFSVKEEQLRTHSHTIHQGHSNQTHADQSTPKPMNHDYLTGMYEMSELYDMNDSPEAAEGQTEQYSKSSSEMNKLDRLSMELEEDEVTLFEQPCQSPKVHQTVRRTSILRSADRSCVGSDGEQPSSGIQKRVRFSLGSTHLSPALEAEYGGRSNRRRLLDFARRRQMSAQPNDTPGLCTLFFLWVIYSPLCLLIRCLKQIIYVLLYIRVKFILWSCLLGLLLFPFSLITCWSVLRLPWTQVPDQLIHFGQSHLQLTQSNDSLSGSMQQLCSRFLVWFGRCLTSTPSTDS